MNKLVSFIRNISLKNVATNVLVFLVGYWLIHTYQTWDTPSGTVPKLEGINVQTSQWLSLQDADKPVLVHFWATWCKICEFEHSTIKSLAQDYSVFTVASQSGSLTEVKQFIQEKQLDFPVILDPNGEAFSEWGGVGYPTSFIVNENNEVEFVEAGFTTELGLRTRLFLAKLF